ncbi:MAG: rRNA maturation RNase YbeY [Candidatus Paceibacteria bacterium]|jgi:rRNA maturation RNase YbeY
MRYEEKDNLEVIRKTQGDIPNLPFSSVKNSILGKKYNLSLSFIKKDEMKDLSKKHKGSYNHMNTLAFELDEDSGEIVMNLQTIRIEAKKHDRTYLPNLLFMFIHSCLHLKDYKHGDEMEKLEDKYFNKFNI